MLLTDPKNPPKVPEGWLAKYDDKYKAFFFVDLKTRRSQWEAPPGTTIEISADEVKPPPYSPHEYNSSQSLVLNQNNTSRQQVQPQQSNHQQPYPQQSYYQQVPPQQYVQQVPLSPRSSGLGFGSGLVGGMLVGNMMRSRRNSCPPRRRRC